MALSLTQSATAVAANCVASFAGVGGVEPYLYTVLPGGAGGTIDPSSGAYTAPAAVVSQGPELYDTIQVEDYAAATATAVILAAQPLLLLCEIIQLEMGLTNGRVYLWDQKIMQPKDDALYVAISVMRSKPFGNVNRSVSAGGGMNQEQWLAVQDTVEIDVISRSPEARDRRMDVLLALNSVYAKQQMAANSFYVSPLASNFVDLSHVDGAAIPYRFKITVHMHYAYAKTKAAQYFDDFSDAEITQDP